MSAGHDCLRPDLDCGCARLNAPELELAWGVLERHEPMVSLRAPRTSPRRIVLVGFCDELEDLLSNWAGELELGVIGCGFEPACELDLVGSAPLVLVDGGRDLVFAMAECCRLRLAGCPVVLVAEPTKEIEAAARRGGIAMVLPSPVTQGDFERCVRARVSVSAPECGIQLALTANLFRDARSLWVDGQEVRLSAQKFDLLCYLLDRAGIAVSAGDLVRGGLLRPSQAQRYKGLIQELRRHLGSARDLIRAVPGYGYRLDLPRKPSRSEGEWSAKRAAG